MKIEQMKEIAAKRTEGKFSSWHFTTLDEIPVEQQRINNQFLAVAADNFDKMIKVAEAAKKATDELGVTQPGYPSPVANANKLLRDALKELENE